MKLNLAIDDELADKIICTSLVNSIDITKQSIHDLKRIKKLKPYQAEDLEYNENILRCLNAVLEYYGGTNYTNEKA